MHVVLRLEFCAEHLGQVTYCVAIFSPRVDRLSIGEIDFYVKKLGSLELSAILRPRKFDVPFSFTNMSQQAATETAPPKLRPDANGGIDPASIADLVEWFLNYDERTARMRHPHTEELFQWKQQDDAANGVAIYPFENAEARFAIGAFQALQENNSEPLLGLWLNDVLAALHESRETKREITEANDLDKNIEASAIEKSTLLTTKAERRLYLTSAWLETLCTAEARVLGWIYQEIYGKPFTPAS